MARTLIYKSALQITVDAFYDITLEEIRRLQSLKRREQVKLYGPATKVMTRIEGNAHRNLVRWLLAVRLRENGKTLAEIAEELRLTRQRVSRMLLSGEPQPPGRRPLKARAKSLPA